MKKKSFLALGLVLMGLLASCGSGGKLNLNGKTIDFDDDVVVIVKSNGMDHIFYNYQDKQSSFGYNENHELLVSIQSDLSVKCSYRYISENEICVTQEYITKTEIKVTDKYEEENYKNETFTETSISEIYGNVVSFSYREAKTEEKTDEYQTPVYSTFGETITVNENLYYRELLEFNVRSETELISITGEGTVKIETKREMWYPESTKIIYRVYDALDTSDEIKYVSSDSAKEVFEEFDITKRANFGTAITFYENSQLLPLVYYGG